MAQLEYGSINNKIDEKSRKNSRWGWQLITARANTKQPESAPAQVPAPAKGEEEPEKRILEQQAAVLAPVAQPTTNEPKQNDLIATKVESEQPRQHFCGEAMVASAAKPKSRAQSSAANSRGAQDEPEVRINIIVDPDSGETVGTVTLMDDASTRLSCLDSREQTSSLQDTQSLPTADEKAQTVSEDEQRLAENEHLSCDARHTPTPEAEDTPDENTEPEPGQLPDSLPTDLYSDMTPTEAAAEQKRLESWINWAIITGRDPEVWRQRRKAARKRAARRRVLKRRAGVYGQRFKDALLLREGHHATHASFKTLRDTT